VNDPVDRLIAERAALDRGFPGGLLVSGAIHLLIVGTAIAGPLLLPKPPLIRIVDGPIVALPPGGGGEPAAAPPAPAPPKPEPPKPKEEAPKPEPPKQIIKPPKDQPHSSKAVPPVDSKLSKKPAKTTPTPVRQASSAGAPGGTGKSSQTPGLGLEVGPGVPGGTDPNGDWYLAGVQRKIWTIWTQQIHTDMSQSVTVRFTILADGTVDSVEIAQPSGVYLLDTAAQRTVSMAAPFSPLPKTYDTTRITIQAIFKPTS
jgi:TonB family protein